MFGYRGDRKLDGEPGIYDPGPEIGTDFGPNPYEPEPLDDPLHTSIQTYTLMLNVYKDLGNFNRFVPYIGAGIGLAIHDVDEVYFTGNPNLLNRIEGERDVSFAWSLMAGVGYQISDRAILDVGYRYIDMGSAQSGRVERRALPTRKSGSTTSMPTRSRSVCGITSAAVNRLTPPSSNVRLSSPEKRSPSRAPAKEPGS